MSSNSNRVLLVSEEECFIESLVSDLDHLGYSVFVKGYSELETGTILRLEPDVVLFDFTVWNEEVLPIYKGVKSNSRLENLKLAFFLLVSEESLLKISDTLEFDDLIIVPCKNKELKFRLTRMLWQKNKVISREIIKIDDLVINLASYNVSVKGSPIELTFKEYELLKYLATHRGRAFNRETLLNIVWGYDYYGGTRTVDVHIRRIRSKIGDIRENHIKTVRGVGYMFRE